MKTPPSTRLQLQAIVAALLAAASAARAEASFDTFATDPGIAGSWTHTSYYGTTGTATWNMADQDLDLAAGTSDRWSLLRPSTSTRSPTDPVTVDVTSVSRSGTDWAVVGLTVCQNPTGKLTGDTSPKYVFFMQTLNGTDWFYRVRKDGTANLYTSPTFTFSGPVTMSIERNGANYEFKANGGTLYTGTSYSSAVHDGLVHYHLTWGSGINASMTAKIDNFGAGSPPSPPAALQLLIAWNGGNLDFEWESMAGMQYDLLSSTDLSTDPETWPPYDDGVNPPYENIPSAGATTTLTGVAKVEPARFFVLREEEIPPPPPLLAADFESDNGSFTVSTTEGTAWAWGDPDSTGVGGSVTTGADSSANCWGAGIGNPGFYADPTTTSLRSPVIDLTGVSAAQVSFAEALDIEAGDSAQVFILDDTTDTEIAGPIYTATDGNVNSASWAAVAPVPIPAPALGQAVRIEWRFTGTAGATDDYMGWYIDNVLVEVVSP